MDERCTFLKGDKDAPKSILLSLDEDNFAGIASFLEPEDFAHLASTCKCFGLKRHKICDEEVSFMQKIAYKLYEGASPGEKEALPVYKSGESPFLFYEELLELRKPLKFDLLLGRGIDVAGDGSKLVKPNPRVAIKTAPGTDCFHTAVSSHVMRAGKHYVTFKCHEAGNPLWFGAVRPLQELDTTHKSIFSPLDESNELRELQNPEWGDCDVHCCVYEATTGQCQWTDWSTGYYPHPNPNPHSLNWKGMQSFEGGKIGLLLDYEKGTLTVFKNDIKLGVIKEEIAGEYSWMVTVGSWFQDQESSSGGIKIERCPPPAGDESAIEPHVKKLRTN